MVQLKTIINSLLFVAAERPGDSNLVSVWNRKGSFPKVNIEFENEELEMEKRKSSSLMLA
jgi:hypothetical protein